MPDPNLDPNLAFTYKRAARYPSPFFDLSQQYIPTSVRELFKWCTFFYYNSPLVGATINKISRYPITEPIFEEPDESARILWEDFFVRTLKLKDRLMECNLDVNVYGNGFFSMFFPFTRFLICEHCRQPTDIRSVKWRWAAWSFNYKCPTCKRATTANYRKGGVRDVPYRSPEHIRLIRWNPENLLIKFNEATGETYYSYRLTPQTKYYIDNGDPDILAGIPLLFIDAHREQRLIRLSTNNLFHMKRPTLAEKDMGLGKPIIMHILKDLYYLFTLRRGQEAIANEHISPFDFIFPQTGQADPYVHVDLASWQRNVKQAIENHRRDPSFKAVIPVPVGFGRLGGDGRAMLLTPELQIVNQGVVGGMGIPIEFLFGGLNWTGSSISLRSLQNDFLHNQTQLRELTLWIKDRVRTFMGWPDCKDIRFADFKMADDVQKIQQMIALNAAQKLSDRTLLTELSLDYEQEIKRMTEEIETKNKLSELMAKGQAKISGETQLVTFNYQEKIRKLQNDAMADEPGPQLLGAGMMTPEGIEQPMNALPPGAAAMPGIPGGDPGMAAPQAAPPTATDPESGQAVPLDVHRLIKQWAGKLAKMGPDQAFQMIERGKQQYPNFWMMVEQVYNSTVGQPAAAGNFGGPQANPGTAGEVNMDAMPEIKAPRRAGAA